MAAFVCSAGTTVAVAGNVKRTDAVVWAKADIATSFPAPTVIGAATGQPDYAGASIAAAPDGTLYTIWIDQEGSGALYLRFNARLAVNVRDRSYAHLVTEVFGDDRAGITTRYTLLAAAIPAGRLRPSARPVLADGAAITRQRDLPLTVTDVQGNPTQARWRWGSAPTDAASDSGGWQPLTAPLTATLPRTITPCAPLTLVAQLRNGQGTVSAPLTTTIRVDDAVQASLRCCGAKGARDDQHVHLV